MTTSNDRQLASYCLVGVCIALAAGFAAWGFSL